MDFHLKCNKVNGFVITHFWFLYRQAVLVDVVGIFQTLFKANRQMGGILLITHHTSAASQNYGASGTAVFCLSNHLRFRVFPRLCKYNIPGYKMNNAVKAHTIQSVFSSLFAHLSVSDVHENDPQLVHHCEDWQNLFLPIRRFCSTWLLSFTITAACLMIDRYSFFQSTC